MRIVLTAAGSTGDLHPMVGLGRGLRRRGHDVVVVGEPGFRDACLREALGFVATEAAGVFHELARCEARWGAPTGAAALRQALAAAVRLDLAVIARACGSARTLLVFHSLSLAGRLWRELGHTPAATVHLSPWAAAAAWTDASASGGGAHLTDRLLAEECVTPALNTVRAEFGLAPVDRVFRSWIHSPDCVLGLFPPWFGETGGWPETWRMTGFPRYDEADHYEIDAGLRAFMASGEPPIAFTPGSSSPCAPEFLMAGVEAAVRAGRRAILLTRVTHAAPPRLPAGVVYVPYAPFSWLLPRCAALVHHGGIGTAAQALAAGIPQITIPFGFDQWDNAARLRRLGVAASLNGTQARHGLLPDLLQRVLDDAAMAAACRRWAAAIAARDAVEDTCAILEAAAGGAARTFSSPRTDAAASLDRK